MNRRLSTVIVCLPALVGGCNEPHVGVAIGGFCQVSSDCASPGACILGVCIEDDFFHHDAPEGEPQGGGGTDVEFSSDCYHLPVEPYQIVGYHHGSSVGGGLKHAGDDCKGSAGTAIHAIYGGTIRYAGEAGSWGGLVEVEHHNPVDDGVFYSIYGHMRASELLVSQGQTVTTGQQLGVLGTTAENGGWIEHLHFSIYTGQHPAQGVLKGHIADLTGYQDPIPWLTDNCVACKCEGALSDATIADDSLFVAGTVMCEGGIDAWSVAVHDQVVHSESPGGAAIAFAETVDLTQYGFADSDAPIGLWARPVGGEACLLDSRIVTPGVDGGECVPNDHTVCKGYDVYWADSCGGVGGVAEDCVDPELCVATSQTSASCKAVPVSCGDGTVDPGEDCDGGNLNGASCITQGHDSGQLVCSAACTFDASACCDDEDHYQCYQGNVHWYDSCGVVGGVKESCANGCDGAACVEPCKDTYTVTNLECEDFSSADGSGPGGGELFSVCGTVDPQTGYMTVRAVKQPNDPNPIFGDREYQVRVSTPDDPACGPSTNHFVISDDSPTGEMSSELEFTFQSTWLPGQTVKGYCVTASTQQGDIGYDPNDKGQESWWWSEKIVVTRSCL